MVHTGVVMFWFQDDVPQIQVHHTAIVGPDADAVLDWINTSEPDATFVEGYRPRSHFDTDARMTKAVQDMRQLPNVTVLMNTGVKKVVKRDLMQLLGVWDFATPTHHQDLRSAARIALLGMLKHEPYNRLLTQVVKDHLAGRTWPILKV